MGWLDKVRGAVAGAATDSDPLNALYRQGNALRDQRRWAEAAVAYAAYLEQRPDDRGITVQHGHMVKESGDPARALDLYRQAERMEPDDPDIHIQIGHALKLLGRGAEAALAYQRAAELDPAAVDPWRELAALQRLGLVPAADAAPAVLLDISDLFEWARNRRQPSGIQRVQLGIAAAVLAERLDAGLVATRPGSDGFRPVPGFWFRRLHGLMRSGGGADDPAFAQMRDAMDAVLDGPVVDFARGQVLLTLGSAWALPGYFHLMAAARRTNGLRHVAVVHDMGPVIAPEDSIPALAQAFATWFAGLAQHADGVVVASQATAEDVAQLCSLPVAVVPFDARPDLPVPVLDHPVFADPRPFVAWIGSLEARKDHPFVFAAWKRLAAELGEATPRLVCAGRLAEGAEATLDLLRDDPDLARHVTVLADADDALVAALLGRARFALYHSRHEGWGLPVTEALALGTPIVIPDLPGLRDAARGLAFTVPPRDAAGLVACLAGLMRDDALLDAARARIAAAPPLRGWDDVARDLLAAATRLGTAAPRGTLRKLPPLGFGQRLAIGLPGPKTELREQMIAAQARQGDGWHAPEAWGCWTLPGLALLRLAMSEGSPEMRLRLELRVPPGGGGVIEAAVDRSDASGAWLRLRLPEAGGTCGATLPIPAGEGPMLLRLQADAATDLGDGRSAGIGVVAVTLLAGDDAQARIALLEREAFTMLTLA